MSRSAVAAAAKAAERWNLGANRNRRSCGCLVVLTADPYPAVTCLLHRRRG